MIRMYVFDIGVCGMRNEDRFLLHVSMFIFREITFFAERKFGTRTPYMKECQVHFLLVSSRVR